MTTWFIVSLVIMFSIKLILTSLPTAVVESFTSKFQLHPKLDDTAVTITIDGKPLEGEDKIQVINQFNQALFLEKYYFPPQSSGTPLVINTKRGKKDVSFSIYSYNDHVDVIKQYKKKVVAYSLRSDSLQKRSMLVTGDVV
ncbi:MULTISPECIES: YfmQ family protein [unclassified Bacillus (in: firmicutes)]|uniref:YfmQ family protein n=1 Tax=unclassified Bacillus (in: firmicutes) TaxID=185979 RepID=UPI00232C0591|nr:YfmQ family protein [Bacillus sp. BP-3]MDC2867925.1 YfmQ family protein [Bacillus sp. BP-3]